MNILKVITPDNLGKGITFNPQTKKWEVQSGFDCAALSALPSKPWKKGTTLLAKQDGECIQLTALDSIFQEIGVGIAADKTSAFTGETYNVTVTVTNTGESKNELTNLTVQKPLLGNYEILDVRTSKQAVDEVETLDQLNYNLKGLAKGGTFILRFSVKANDVGTYQFSATVNPNSALDQNAKNNTDTIILKANTKIDTTYVPSVDCPRITATDVETGIELQMYKIKDPKGTYFRTANGANIYANRETLNGVKINLRGASSVTVLRMTQSTQSASFGFQNGSFSYTNYRMETLEPDGKIVSTIDDFTFKNGVLTINSAEPTVVVYARAAGKNCRWQAFVLSGACAPAYGRIIESNVIGGTVTRVNEFTTTTKTGPLDYEEPVVIPAVDYKALEKQIRHSSNRDSGRENLISKLIFRVKAGTAASFDYTKSDRSIHLPNVQGKTTITDNRVTVAADATSTDSINSEYLQVIVED